MPANLVATSFAIVAFGSASAAIYFWRRSSSLYALLCEGANRFEELRQRNSQVEQAMQKADERMRQQREGALRLEKGIEEARDQAAELVKRLEAKEHEVHAVTQKLELQKAHLEKQLAKVSQQLTHAEAARQAAEESGNDKIRSLENTIEQQIVQARQEAKLAAEAARQDSSLRERELSIRVHDLEKELATNQKKLREADPVEMRKLRRRVAQYDRLYNSMKGLREMTDERNRNYEVALSKLSTWILRQLNLLPVPAQIGPLVGTALQAIGAQLIEDNEMPSPVARIHAIPERGATRADTMDRDGDISDEPPSDEALAAEEVALAAEQAVVTDGFIPTDALIPDATTGVITRKNPSEP